YLHPIVSRSNHAGAPPRRHRRPVAEPEIDMPMRSASQSNGHGVAILMPWPKAEEFDGSDEPARGHLHEVTCRSSDRLDRADARERAPSWSGRPGRKPMGLVGLRPA